MCCSIELKQGPGIFFKQREAVNKALYHLHYVLRGNKNLDIIHLSVGNNLRLHPPLFREVLSPLALSGSKAVYRLSQLDANLADQIRAQASLNAAWDGINVFDKYNEVRPAVEALLAFSSRHELLSLVEPDQLNNPYMRVTEILKDDGLMTLQKDIEMRGYLAMLIEALRKVDLKALVRHIRDRKTRDLVDDLVIHDLEKIISIQEAERKASTGRS